jgi:cell division septation protein DedD
MAEAGKAAVPVKVGAKPATRSVPTSPPKFSLQMGAMVMEENAEALKQKLDASGFPAVIRKGTAFVSKQVVTVGEPSSKSAAEDLSRRLNVDGFPSEPLDVGGKYTPQIGAFFNLDEAVDLARELQKKNYHPKITSKPVTTVVYQVRHGMFDSRNAAVERGEELKSKGFNSLVVRE